MTSVRSTPRPTIQRDPRRASRIPSICLSGRAAAAMRTPLCEMVLVGGFVPDDLLLVLERKRRHVAGDGRLLADRRRRDHLLLAQNGLDEVAEMIDGAVGFLVLLRAVDVNGGAGLDGFGRAIRRVGAARIV